MLLKHDLFTPDVSLVNSVPVKALKWTTLSVY